MGIKRKSELKRTKLNKKLLALVKKFGEPYSKKLGIRLEEGRESEVFKWFLAAMLYGGRITEEKAESTYREFKQMGVLSHKKVLATGWDGLVGILDNGGYVRYDFSTATDLFSACKLLEEKYGGRLTRLYEEAKDDEDLRAQLKELRGVGDVTASIFLRELRGKWCKAKPRPTALVLLGAKTEGIKEAELRNLLEKLPPKKSIALETALVRIGKLVRRQSFKPFSRFPLLFFKERRRRINGKEEKLNVNGLFIKKFHSGKYR